MENSNKINSNQKLFIHLTSLYSTIIIIIFIGYLLSFIPNELDKDFIINNYNIDIKYFVAENSEKAQYMICTVLFPIIYLSLYLLIRKFVIKYNFNKNIDLINNNLNIIGFGVVYILIIITNFSDAFYSGCLIKSIFISTNTFLTIIIIILLFFAIIMIARAMVKKNNLSNNEGITKIYFKVISVVSVIYTSYLFITRSYNIFTPIVSLHFDAYFYPVYKVFSGQTPLIDFRSLYGFYPYFIEPILNIFSSINMFGFSVLMAVLVGICLLSITIVLFYICEDKILAVFGVLSIIYVLVIFPNITLDAGVYYLQYLPHRVISPALLLVICTFYVKAKNNALKQFIYLFGYVMAACAILWNIDTGIVVTISYVLFHIYLTAYSYKLNDKKLCIKSLYAVLSGIMSIILAICILFIITYIRTSKVLNVNDIFYGQSIFYKSGFYMLNMPLIHPWILLVAIYAISLAKSLRNMAFVRDGEPIYNIYISSMYFIIPVMGLGLFSYYQGRSHDYVFSAVIWPGLVLLVMFCQEYLIRLRKQDSIKCKKDFGLNLNYIKFAIVLSTLIILSLGSVVNFVNRNQLCDMKNKSNDIGRISETVDFVETIRNKNEPVDLIMNNSATVYSIMREKMAANIPATVDWFTKDDYLQVLEYIKYTNNLIIFDLDSYNLLMKYNDEQLKDIIHEKNYQVSVNHSIDKTYILFK